MNRRWPLLLAFVFAGVGLGSLRAPLGAGLDLARARSWRDSAGILRAYLYLIQQFRRLEFSPNGGPVTFPEAPPGADPWDAALLAYHRGDFAAAAPLFAAAEASAPGQQRRFWQAIDALRLAEDQNCRAHLTAGGAAGPGRCALPLRGPHADPSRAQEAAQRFAALLAASPEDPLDRWLLSIAALNGGVADAVPPEQRLDTPFMDLFYGARAAAIAEEHRWLHLRDEAGARGLRHSHAGKGLAVEDFDDDGWLDVITAGTFDPLFYYRNIEGRMFEVVEGSGLEEATQGHILSVADYDNDGAPDLFVSRPFHGYALLRNRGDGRFEDVTAAVGLAPPSPIHRITWVSAWSDIDLDGDLDLFLCQWDPGLPLLAEDRFEPSRLYLNQGGRFEDGSAAWGVQGLVAGRMLQGAAFGDYDNDGDPDLYLSSPLPGQGLLLNNQGGRLVEVEAPDLEEAAFTAAFLDFNHDGTLDLFLGGTISAEESAAVAMLGPEPFAPEQPGQSRVLLGDPARPGRFPTAVRVREGLPLSTMGSGYGDLNNDGCFDVYLGTGNPTPWMVVPNLLYLGVPEGTGCAPALHNVSMLEGVGTIQKGHGVAFFDVDGDGDEDLYSTLGGLWPADRWYDQLFVNDSAVQNHWLELRLRGEQTNRAGLDARVEVQAVGADGAAIVRRAVLNGRTGFGSGPLLLHIGLGQASRVEAVVVDWPVSRARRRYTVALDGRYALDEGGGARPLSRITTSEPGR